MLLNLRDLLINCTRNATAALYTYLKRWFYNLKAIAATSMQPTLHASSSHKASLIVHLQDDVCLNRDRAPLPRAPLPRLPPRRNGPRGTYPRGPGGISPSWLLPRREEPPRGKYPRGLRGIFGS